ncbi:MAG: hypothetical protein K2X47_20190, partial [Bdellovibrionales bacterium]|nr:hypothetical protein [Bdellovibrionales bacterium]
MEIDPSAKQQVYDHIVHHRIYVCMIAAMRIGIAEEIPPSGIEINELATKLKCDSDFLFRAIKFLACAKIFDVMDNYVFNTPKSLALSPDHQNTRVPHLNMYSSSFFHAAWDALETSIRTGKPGFDIVYGKPFFEFLKQNPSAAEIFDAAMASDPQPRIDALTTTFDFSQF